MDAGCGIFGLKLQRKKGSLTGSFTYKSPHTEGKLKATSFTSLAVNDNTATFEGTCKLGDGSSCTFSVYVEDNGDEPNSKDVFRISINGGPFEGGTLLSGDIRIRA